MPEAQRPTASTMQPLTERVLARLGRPALLWVLLWGLIGPARPWINAGAAWLLGEESVARELLERNALTQWILGYLIVLMLLGTRLIMVRLQDARPAIRRITADDASEIEPEMRGIGSTAAPVTIAVVLTAVAKLGQIGRYPPEVNALDALVLLAALLPLGTWLWTYGCVVIGLDRIGRQALELDPFPPDRGLGLRPLGSLAFVGVGVVAAGIVPYLLVLAREPIDVLVGVVLFLVVIALFVLSLWRLHVQMVGAKSAYTGRAAELYAEAYEPIRTSYDLETVAARAPLLSAAESLEKRAESILEWPIDERIVGRLVLVVTGVVTAVISTFVLQQIGFR